MKLLDFSNKKNRNVRISDVGIEYMDYIHKTTILDSYYPKFHIAPPSGLLNDPNGLYIKDGVYHIFYQWFPLGPVHGLKHWYHLSTTDFINFNNHGIGISPEDFYDFSGCYSGMTYDKKYIYYTGIDKNNNPSVCYAEIFGDSIIKKGDIIQMDNKITTINFRDPFVFKKGDIIIMLVGAENLENKGILPVYISKDNISFQYLSNLEIMEYPYGYMLECPNYFEKENKGILFFSPQGIKSPNKYDFRNVFSVIYMVGTPLNLDMKFDANSMHEMDKGFDFYAPQIFRDDNNRDILIGWLGNSKTEYPTDKNNWAHMLTIPREISLSGDRIVQSPLKELIFLRKNNIKFKNSFNFDTPSHELHIKADKNFIFEISNTLGEKITFEMTDDEFILNRSQMTELYNEKFGYIRYAKRVIKTKQIIKFFIDTSSIEIFADNGMTVFTARYFISQPNKYYLSDNVGEIWELNEINIPYKKLK